MELLEAADLSVGGCAVEGGGLVSGVVVGTGAVGLEVDGDWGTGVPRM